METKIFQSEFDNTIPIAVLGKDDYRYEVIKPIFDKMGFGFMLNDMVFIDGERRLNKHIVKWIEAHEVAHIKLGHTKERNKRDELDADTFAYKLLIERGYTKTAELVKQKSLERHNKQI